MKRQFTKKPVLAASGVSWGYYRNEPFDRINDEYLPDVGQGDTMATQLVVAINKLIYKWYNDGDVYDNNYGMEGWANDLSDYANWLAKYIPGAKPILEEIYDCHSNETYENILKQLADSFLDLEIVQKLNQKPATGDVYNCSGPFSFSEYEEEDDWEEDYY